MLLTNSPVDPPRSLVQFYTHGAFQACPCIRYIRLMSYALLAITELPNNELTSIHTLSLPPLLL